jgi:hypothetical protein
MINWRIVFISLQSQTLLLPPIDVVGVRISKVYNSSLPWAEKHYLYDSPNSLYNLREDFGTSHAYLPPLGHSIPN